MTDTLKPNERRICAHYDHADPSQKFQFGVGCTLINEFNGIVTCCCNHNTIFSTAKYQKNAQRTNVNSATGPIRASLLALLVAALLALL